MKGCLKKRSVLAKRFWLLCPCTIISHTFCLCIIQVLLYRAWGAWTLDGTWFCRKSCVLCQPESLLGCMFSPFSVLRGLLDFTQHSLFRSNWRAARDHLCGTGWWPGPPRAAVHAGGGHWVLVLRNALLGMWAQNNPKPCVLFDTCCHGHSVALISLFLF